MSRDEPSGPVPRRATHRAVRKHGGAVAALVLTGVLVVLGVGAVGFVLLRSGPEDAVSGYTGSFLDGDCDAYQDVTTADLREVQRDGPCSDGYDAEAWQAIEEYQLQVDASEVDDGAARIRTVETYRVASGTDAGEHEEVWQYLVVQSSGDWRVDQVRLLQRDGERLGS